MMLKKMKLRDVQPGMVLQVSPGEPDSLKVDRIVLMNGADEPRTFIGGTRKSAVALKVFFAGREPGIGHPDEDVVVFTDR